MSLLAAYCVADPRGPDTFSCSPRLSTTLKRRPCEAALSHLPQGTLPSIFTTRPAAPENNFHQVPKRYFDSGVNPQCSIDVALDGHSQRDVYVLVPWDKIRSMAIDLISLCVDGLSWGGWETFGLNASFEALISPSRYNGEPAVVHNPDGSEDDSRIAIPEGYGGRNGFNVPLYMVVTVSGPRSRMPQRETDLLIGLSLEAYLKEKLNELASRARMDDITRTATSYTKSFVETLYGDNHPRWWEFTMGPLNPNPTNVKYACNASLGSPSTAKCQAILYESFFSESGDVVLDPASGPLIKTSGDCAIGVKATSKQTTTWELLRMVAERLLNTCITDPLSGTRGGLATSQPVFGRRRRADSNTWPSSLTMAVYLQDPFNGAASDTCAWGVVSSQISSRSGDVRQCPAPPGPWRPPERVLAANGTGFHEWHSDNITVIENGNWTEITEGNLTTTIEDAKLTSVLADLPIISTLPSAKSASTLGA